MHHETKFITSHPIVSSVAEILGHSEDKLLEKACKYLFSGCSGHNSVPTATSGDKNLLSQNHEILGLEEGCSESRRRREGCLARVVT